VNGNCTFKIDVRHSLGKPNICHSCGNVFNMNEYSIRAANPKCMDCVKRRTIQPVVTDSTVNEQITAKDSPNVNIIPTNDVKEKFNSLKVVEYNPDDDSVEL